MTTYYYDYVSGDNLNDGLTPATAKKLYTSVGTVAGDRFLFKRGTTQFFTGMVTARNGTSDTVRSYYGVYGSSATPYVTFRVATGSAIIMNGAGSKYITFEDIYFDMQDFGVSLAVYCASQGANQTFSNTFRRCYFTGSNNGAGEGGSGLSISRETSATASGPTDYVIEDCDFWGNAEHGLFVLASTNIKVRRCRFWGNGFNDSTGGHGFSARAAYTIASSGWTLHSGTIWKRTMAAPETDAWYVRNLATPYHLTRNTGTPTAPATNQYGVSGGILYINVGSASNPSTQAVTYVWALCSGIVVEDCESHDNISDDRTPGTEGHGFVFDDWADSSIFRRNKSYNNEGYGFSNNKGGSNLYFGNIAYGNGGSGILANAANATSVIHNIFVNNNQLVAHARDAEVVVSYGSSNAVVSNNILSGSVLYGINTDPADSGHTGVTNTVHGFTNITRVAILTGSDTNDPLLDVRYRPASVSCRRTGTHIGGKDYYGKTFYNPPNIGAVDDATEFPRYILKPE